MAQDILVTTDWLEQRLDHEGLVILDCRYAFDHDARLDYLESHIPGAFHFNWDAELSDPDHEVQFMIAPPERVKQAMERIGVGDDTTIVAYDQEGGHFASRVWLVLARYGHGDQLRILDGGWTAWQQEGRPTTSDVPDFKLREGSFTLDESRYRPELIADARDVQRASESNVVVLDVRRMSEFTGEEARAKRGGRVPGAVWSFWQDNLNWESDRRFRSQDEIVQRASEAGVQRDTPVITYCQGGVRAAHAAVALMRAGYENVRVYDGSWAEWGNRDDLPIETGEPIG